MLSLPTPERGGSIEEFRPFLNLRTDDDFVLIVSWLLGALRARGPYPVLNLYGEVAGVVDAKTVSGGIQGAGLAIAANTVNVYLERLKAGEIVTN